MEKVEKSLYILLGIILAISIVIGIYIFSINNQIMDKSPFEGEWNLIKVIADGKRVPNIDEDPGFVDTVYYSPEQSVIFQSGSIRGFDGCDYYRGDLQMGSGGRLDISELVLTGEGCAEGFIENSDGSMVLVTKYDSSHFLNDLLSVDRVEIQNNILVLIDDGPPIKQLFFYKVDE